MRAIDSGVVWELTAATQYKERLPEGRPVSPRMFQLQRAKLAVVGGSVSRVSLQFPIFLSSDQAFALSAVAVASVRVCCWPNVLLVKQKNSDACRKLAYKLAVNVREVDKAVKVVDHRVKHNTIRVRSLQAE